jgi:glycine oxidase
VTRDNSSDLVVIIGGGAIGLSIGWLLRKKGFKVTLLEEGECGRDASWASAGMLSPDIPKAEDSQTRRSLLTKLLELQVKSYDMWPSFAKELFGETGVDVDLLYGGSIGVALDSGEEESLEANYSGHVKFGMKIEHLSVQEALQLEPNLNPAIRKAVFRPDDGQVEPRKLVQALKDAFVKSGGELHEHTPVRKIVIDDSSIRAVVTPQETLPIEDSLILAAGAWSSSIEGIPRSLIPPIRPMKGQMLAVAMEKGFANHIILGEHGYYVPRKSGRLVVGATFEDVGFDSSNTAGGILDLLRKAYEVFPTIRNLPIVESWVGLRPRSLDDAPVLGPTKIRGLIVATGHFHIGIIMTPITAHLISDFVASGTLSQDLEPFTANRFAGTS